jgi:hypothetical protein
MAVSDDRLPVSMQENLRKAIWYDGETLDVEVCPFLRSAAALVTPDR